MNRQTLMDNFKEKFGGEYVRENGRWYWKKDNEKNLVSNSWLMYMLKNTPKQEVPPYEVSEYTHKTLVEDTGNETSVEEQEPENETAELSEEELKKELQRQKRRERRAKKKLKEQKENEQ